MNIPKINNIPYVPQFILCFLNKKRYRYYILSLVFSQFHLILWKYFSIYCKLYSRHSYKKQGLNHFKLPQIKEKKEGRLEE